MLIPCFRAVVALCVVSVVLEVSPQPSPRFPRADRCMSEPLQGRAYSAEFKVISLQLLASGEEFTHNSTERQARDAHGRFYHSGVFPPTRPGMEDYPPLVTAHICDSAANTLTMWSSVERRTIVLHLPPPDTHRGCWRSDTEDFTLNFEKAPRDRPSSDSPPGERPIPERADETGRAKPTVERLGPELVQGVEALGYRSFFPPAQDGQKDPPYLSEEHWVATSLGIWVMQEVTYPRKLNSTLKWSREPVGIEVSEPDPLLFEPPQEYPVTSLEMHQVSCTELAPPAPAQSPHLH